MRIRDAITKPVLLAGVGALALGAITAIAVVGSSAPARESFGCRMRVTQQIAEPPKPPPAPPQPDARPLPTVSL